MPRTLNPYRLLSYHIQSLNRSFQSVKSKVSYFLLALQTALLFAATVVTVVFVVAAVLTIDRRLFLFCFFPLALSFVFMYIYECVRACAITQHGLRVDTP